MNKIDRRRFPDIEYEGKIYSYDGVETPLEQVLNATNGKSIFLVGNGGQGKSTALFSYWLDHIADRNCIYVDMRGIKSEEGRKACAISDYISAKYHLALKNLSRDTLILLDGVNEAPIDLRRFNGSGCDLLTEIVGIHERVRFVISSRNQTITVYPREYIPQSELTDETIKYCELLSLTSNQVVDTIKKNSSYVLNPALLKLLENNAMLSMFNDAQLMGIEIFSQDEEICAGVLLDKYFDRYLRLKFIQLTAPTSKSAAEIFDLIEQGDEDIGDANKKWEKLCGQLTDLAFCSKISKKDLISYNGSSLPRLGIFREVKDGYVWGDEIYEEYFEALHIRGVIDKLYRDDNYLMEFVCWVDNSTGYWTNNYSDWENKIICDDSSCHANIRNYNSIQFAGELLGFTESQYAQLKERLLAQILCNPYMPKYNFIDQTQLLTIMCILACKCFPKNISIVGSCLITDCKNLIEIEIPGSIEIICNHAFLNCTNLSNVVLQNGIKEIQEGAFSGCSKLGKISIPDSVKSIGDYAFSNCTSLQEVEIGQQVNRIGGSAFLKCRNLQNIRFGACLEEIKSCAFSRCSSLTKIEIPSSVTKIGECAFEYCLRIQNIIIPDSILFIEAKSFRACISLRHIFIPKSVGRIGAWVFANCDYLTDIYCELESQPNTWNIDWLRCDAVVHWGVSREEYNEIVNNKTN